jgi:hypothetical protein
MRILALLTLAVTGCATTTAEISKQQPYATFSSAKPMATVLACVQGRINTFEWGLCPRAEPSVVPREGADRGELVITGPRGTDAALEGQAKGDSAVYELRVSRQADWGLCSMSGVFKELTRICM